MSNLTNAELYEGVTSSNPEVIRSVLERVQGHVAELKAEHDQ